MILDGSRRAFLQGWGVVLACVLPGCSAFGNQAEEFTFCHLELYNEDDRPHRLHISIDADGDTIHEEWYDLSSATGNVVSDVELDPQEWFDGTAETLTLEGHLEDLDSTVEVTASDTSDSAEIIYHVRDDGSLEITRSTTGSESCSTPSE